jgi:hypothetical protein
MFRIICLLGWHNWWGAGGDELVCLDRGRKRRKLAAALDDHPSGEDKPKHLIAAA